MTTDEIYDDLRASLEAELEELRRRRKIREEEIRKLKQKVGNGLFQWVRP